MNRNEWRQLAADVNSDISAMTRAAQTQTDVRAVLGRRSEAPTEEQFIDEEAFDSPPNEPRTFQVAGRQIKVWKIHRLDLDLGDVKGADLYYELGDHKFVLVQYKIPNAAGRVVLDEPQMDELQDACPVLCPPTERFSCGSWYALRKDSESVYFPACEAREIFGRYASRKSEFFVNGLTKEQFQRDFGVCRLGARTQLIHLELYQTFAVKNDRIFVHVKNRNGGDTGV